MVGQANFSQKTLQGKSCRDIQDMLLTQKGIDWEALPTCQKRGSCVIKRQSLPETEETAGRNNSGQREGNWSIDTEILLFRGDDRQYIEQFIYVGEQ